MNAVDTSIPMMKLFDVLYDHGPATLAYVTQQMEPMGAPAVLKSLRLFYDRGDLTCEKVGVGVVWGLSDAMREQIATKRVDTSALEPPRVIRESPTPREKAATQEEKRNAAPITTAEPKPRATTRKQRSTVVRQFVPARPEIIVGEMGGFVWITARMPEVDEPVAELFVEPSEVPVLTEALQLAQRCAARTVTA